MQIKKDGLRQGIQSDSQATTPKSTSQSHAKSGSSHAGTSTFTRVAKAAALGLLAAPAAAAGRPLTSEGAALALPGHQGAAATQPHAVVASRQLLQASVCGCELGINAGHIATTATVGNGYTRVDLSSAHTQPVAIVAESVGATVDVYGFNPAIDQVGMAQNAYAAQTNNEVWWVANNNNVQILYVPQGAIPLANTTGRTMMTLHGLSDTTEFTSGHAFTQNTPGQGLCTTQVSGGVAQPGTGATSCGTPPPPAVQPPPMLQSPPPPVVSPPPPRLSPPPPVVVSAPPPPPRQSPPPPTPVIVSSPPPAPAHISVLGAPPPVLSGSPPPVVVSSPPPPSPVVVSSPPPPSPVVVSSPPPRQSPPPPSPVVVSLPPPPPPASPAPAPKSGGSSSFGIAAAAGGIAGGAALLGGGYLLMRRRRNNARLAREARENNVEMGAPPTVPMAAEGPTSTDAEFNDTMA